MANGQELMVRLRRHGIPMQRYGIILINQNKNQIIFAYLSIFIQNIGLRGFQPHFLPRHEKLFSFPRRKFFLAWGRRGGE
jgi:hypothetical protein